MIEQKRKFKSELIGFDADDTLWETETFFYNAQKNVANILDIDPESFNKELLDIEQYNLKYYGYGVKGFILSLIEVALKFSDEKNKNEIIKEILNYGKLMVSEPVRVFPNVEKSLISLSKKFVLILITKGDLYDQEKKIKSSKLSKYFDYTEIVSEKNKVTYQKILKKYKIKPQHFIMVGNSLKSDIIPVNEIGGKGIYIPYKLTSELEKVDPKRLIKSYKQLKDISFLEGWLEKNYKGVRSRVSLS